MPKDNPGNSGGPLKGFGGANADKLGRFGAGNQGNSGNGNGNNQGSGNAQGNVNGNGNNEGHGGGHGNESNGSGSNGSNDAMNGNDRGEGGLNGSGQGNSSGGLGGKDQGMGGSKQGGGSLSKGLSDGKIDQGGADKLGGQAGSKLGGKASSGLSDMASDKAGEALKGSGDDPLVDGAYSGDQDQDKDKNGDDNGLGNDGSDLSKGLSDGSKLGGNSSPLGNLTSKLPKPMQKAGGAIGKAYGKLNNAAVGGVMKLGGKSGLNVKAAQAIVHMLFATTAGVGGFMGFNVLNSTQNTLNSTFVCTTTNDSGSAFTNDNNGNTTEAAGGSSRWYGDYKDPSSHAYQIYKMIYKRLLQDGMDLTQAAGVAGGVAQEDSSMDPIEKNSSGDGGFGFFQVTPSTSGHDALKYAEEHGVDLYKNSSATIDPNDPKQMAHIMDGMEAKVDVEVDEYVQDFIQHSGYLRYRGTYQRTAYLAAEVEAHGSVNTGTVPDTNLDKRESGARFVMEKYAPEMHDIGPKLSYADANAAAAEERNDDMCNTQGYGDDGADGQLVSMAKRFMGKVSYSQNNRGAIHDNPPGGQADCSSFVWFIMKQCGYSVPSVPFNTVSMVSDQMKPYLKIVSADDAKAGDIFVINRGYGAGDDGHTGILLQDWHGDNTMVINEGGDGDNVNISTFGYACYPTLEGGKIQFVRPLKRISGGS